MRGTYCGKTPGIDPATIDNSNSRSGSEMSADDSSAPAGGREAALLYFDEMQITDPFTAVSLKGLLPPLSIRVCR